MQINLKNGQGEIEGKCPNCQVELEVLGLPRWNSYSKCPNCNEPLKFHFDFIVMDDGDESDIYEIKIGNPIF